MFFGSEERIIEPSKADGHGQADEQQGRAHAQGNEVPPGKGALGIPGALAVLAEAAQLHRIGNGVDAVQAGQDERQQDVDREFFIRLKKGSFLPSSTPRACWAWLMLW